MTTPGRDAWCRILLCQLSLTLVVVCLIAGCGPQPLTVTHEPVTLRIVVAQSCEPLLDNVAAAYESYRPWVTVKPEVLNNALAADALLEEKVDVALLSWSPADKADGDPLWIEPFGVDGIVIVVHPAAPFSAVGMAQLREIFEGRLQEWEGVVLTVLSREGDSGIRNAFEQIVLDGTDTSLNAVVMPSDEATMDYVATHASAIGYVSARHLDERVRALPVEGVAPKQSSIADGSYPIRHELVLATYGEPVGEARQFIQWLLRAAASHDWEEFSLTP